jgi:glutaredoxin 3
VAAKQLLKSKGLEYTEIEVEKMTPQHMMAFTSAYPEARQMPQIFIDKQRVGGLAGLQAALKQVGL